MHVVVGGSNEVCVHALVVGDSGVVFDASSGWAKGTQVSGWERWRGGGGGKSG